MNMTLSQLPSVSPSEHHRFTMKALALAVLPFSASLASLLPAPAQAQGLNALEEVIVTARKREETLQEVPVVVNVLTEDMISSQRIESIRDISTIVPGMVASKAISGTSGLIYLRGIGTGSGNPAFDQAVAINVDGMGINSAQMMNAGMFDLKQIEVLKGPQALFYGKNSPGGVIAIHTNDPGDEFELEVNVMYESVSEETTLQGVVSGPLSDTFGARLAFGYSETQDHWFTAVNEERFETGPLGPVQTAYTTGNLETETTFLLGTLLWEPTDNFSAKLKFAHLEDNETGPAYGAIQKIWCPNGNTPQGAFYPVAGFQCKADDQVISPGVSPALLAGLNDGEFAGETRPHFDNENNFAVVELSYDLSDALSLTSVTGYFDNKETRLSDSSFEVAVGLPATFLTELDQWSQELRLVSNYDGAVNFTLGAFYEDKEIHRDSDVAAGVPALVPVVGVLFPISIGRQIRTQEGTAWSVFGQVDWDLNEQWTLAVGGRYSSEEKEVRSAISIGDPNVYGIAALPLTAVPLANPKTDWNNFSPEVTLSYQHNDDVMFFASYREGFKSGGYDISYGVAPRLGAVAGAPALDLSYDEETVDGFEIGMKSTLLDGTLRFNVTAFAYAYEDLQLSKFDGDTLSFSIFNAGEASVEGLEVETIWNTQVEGLTLMANLAFLNAEFDEFLSPCWSGQTIAFGCESVFDPDEGAVALRNNMAGESLPFASDLSATLGANYDTAISDNWNLAFNFNASYKDDFNPISQKPPTNGTQEAYWWVNAGVSLYSSDNKWEVFLRGVNLTDEVYINSGGPAPGQGNAMLNGTNDASGLPDWISFVEGGQQINVGFTFRM